MRLMRLGNHDEDPMVPFLYWKLIVIPSTNEDVEMLNNLKSMTPKEIIIKYE